MPLYEVSSSRGGISDYGNRGIAGSFKFASGIDIRKLVDSISCQQALIDESSGVFVDLVRFFVDGSDGNTYGFGNTGKIYKRDINNDWTVVYTDPDGAIKGAAEWPSDDGKAWLVWATNTKLKCKELPGASDWSDVNSRANFPRTDLTSADWHTMRPAGGDLIIANKATLAALGYDSSYATNVLDIVPGNVIKTIVERHGRTIIGTERSGASNQGINAAIDGEVPLAQIGTDGELIFSDMTESLPATRFSGGGRVNPGGVDLDTQQSSFFEWVQAASSNPDINSWIDKKSVGGMTLWGVFGAEEGKGGVWSYGRKRKNHPFVLNLEYPLDSDEIGAIKKVGSDLLVSYRDDTTYGVKSVSATTKGQAIWEGLELRSPTKTVEKITNWKYAEIYMKPLPSGCSVQFWYRVNKDGSFVQANQQGGDTDFDTVGGEKAVFQISAEGEIFEPRLVLIPSSNETPEIYRQRYFFE